MDTKKWTLYLTLLVAGYATGIGTFGLFPQFWLKYGTTGLGVYLLFTAILGILAIIEAETIQKSGYHFTELYTKLTPNRGMLIAAFVILVLFLSYYTANVGLTLLGPFIGTETTGRIIAKVIIIGLAFLIISRAREKTFLIMAWGGVAFVVLTLILGIIFRTTISPDNAYLQMAYGMLYGSHGITPTLIKDAATRAMYGVGLGLMFYLMLGSFLGKNFNAKVIVGGGILIQVLVGILATYAIIYGASQAAPGLLLNYVSGGEEAAIEFMGNLVNYLTSTQVLLLGLGLFLAGLTSILPTFEVALQMTAPLIGVGRNKGAQYVAGIALLVGLFNSVPLVADVCLQGVNVAIFAIAAFEAIPIAYKLKSATPVERLFAFFGLAVFVALGVEALVETAKLGGVYWGSVVIALIVLLIGAVIRKPPEE